jgi:hypothetical protein
MNHGVKIVRLQSGEDILAGYQDDPDSDLVMLDNPMHLIFKRTTQGTVMMLLPWLPIELIKSNIATIYTADILTTIEPKETLVEYYGNLVQHENLKLIKENALSLNLREALDEMEDDGSDTDNVDVMEYEEHDDDDLSEEDMQTIMEMKKTGRLH